MEDKDLERYLDKHGDRMALKTFCKVQISKNDEPSTSTGIVERIRAKLGRKRKALCSPSNGNGEDSEKGKMLLGNTLASKNDRRVEIGWLHEERNGLRQVKSKTGGGVRHLRVKKDITMEDLLKVAKDLFFPNGQSPRGTVDDFTFDIRDFGERSMEQNLSIGEIYEATKVRMLRLYMCTKTTNDELPQKGKVKTTAKGKAKVKDSKKTKLLIEPRLENVEIISPEVSHDDKSLKPDTGAIQSEKGSEVYDTASGVNSTESPTEELHEATCVADLDIDPGLFLTSPEEQQRLLDEANQLLADDSIQLGPLSTSSSDTANEELEDTVPLEASLRLHRGAVFRELTHKVMSGEVNEYSTSVTVTMVLPNGTEEKGEDTGGVFRDALTEFWETFYEKCTVGNEIKVPTIRHDMNSAHWKAVASVLVLGYRHTGYFPIRLAPPFLAYCFKVDDDLYTSTDSLRNVFWKYLPEMERETLQNALKDYPSVEQDDLLEVLGSHDVKTIASEANIGAIVDEMAHKELVQAPAYIRNAWKDVLVHGLTPLLGSPDFSAFVEGLQPTARKVLQMLDFPTNRSPAEESIASYLKKYVKLSRPPELHKFLRFCTGKGYRHIEYTLLLFSAIQYLRSRCLIIKHVNGNS